MQITHYKFFGSEHGKNELVSSAIITELVNQSETGRLKIAFQTSDCRVIGYML